MPKLGKKHELLILCFIHQAKRGSEPQLQVPLLWRSLAGVALQLSYAFRSHVIGCYKFDLGQIPAAYYISCPKGTFFRNSVTFVQ